MTASYDGGTILRSTDGKFELKFGGRMQTRYELTKSFADDGEANQQFAVPRTRVTMEGTAFTPRVRFKLEGSFGDNGFARLRDFYIDGEIFPKVWVRAGQFKRPWNRQEIVSDFATELPEKALTNDLANGGRDIGVMIHNMYDKSPEGLEWAIGLFNGQGDRALPRVTTVCTDAMPPVCTSTVAPPTNLFGDWQPQLVARLGVNVGGIKGYSEADLEGGPLRLAAAVGYRLLNIQDTEAAPLTHALEIDMMLKISGVDLNVAGFLLKVKERNTQFAGHVQAGAFLTPKRFQLVARFAANPLPVGSDGSQEYALEIRGGPQVYFWGHNLKISTDIGVVQSTAEGADPTLIARVQGQIIF